MGKRLGWEHERSQCEIGHEVWSHANTAATIESCGNHGVMMSFQKPEDTPKRRQSQRNGSRFIGLSSEKWYSDFSDEAAKKLLQRRTNATTLAHRRMSGAYRTKSSSSRPCTKDSPLRGFEHATVNTY